jgi:hypothetical protein
MIVLARGLTANESEVLASEPNAWVACAVAAQHAFVIVMMVFAADALACGH